MKTQEKAWRGYCNALVNLFVTKFHKRISQFLPSGLSGYCFHPCCPDVIYFFTASISHGVENYLPRLYFVFPVVSVVADLSPGAYEYVAP